MTGSWAGAAGEQVLEENWTRPVGGSIASLVRMTGAGATSMVELIVIEEEHGSLVLRIQQWNPGFAPRTPGPQTMMLSALGDNEVSFEASGEGELRSLTYRRPTSDSFSVAVETAEGAKFQIDMRAN